MYNIGVMQGRLVPQEDERIQSFPRQKWRDEFALIRKTGLGFIEWTLDYDGLYENPLMNQGGREEIVKLSSLFSVVIPSVTCDCFMQAPFWKVKEHKSQKKIIDDFMNVLAAASNLGMEIIVLPLVDGGAIKEADEALFLIDFFNKNKNIIKKLNLKVAFEIDLAPPLVKAFMESLPPKYFGVNYDSGNSASLGFDVKREFFEYGSYVINCHIKDRVFLGETVALGMGNVCFPSFFKALKKNGYRGNIVLQAAREKGENEVDTIQRYNSFIFNFLR
jgi:hexulose-6-phosphate isomerase